MSDNQNKRKQGPSGSGPALKKSKVSSYQARLQQASIANVISFPPQGSTAGKWKTTQQKAKMVGRVEMGNSLDVGDEGIWVTYARGMNTRAFKEFSELCDEV